jgi:hypothetical protein
VTRYGAIALGVIVVCIYILAFLFQYVFKQPVGTVINKLAKSLEKYTNAKTNPNGNAVKQIIIKIVMWVVRLVIAAILILKQLLTWWFLLFSLIVFTLGTILLLAELHQNDIVTLTDQSMSIARIGTNYVTATANMIKDTLLTAVVPFYNVYVEFIIRLLLTVLEYLLPVLSEEEYKPFDKPLAFGGNSGRLLKSSELPIFPPFEKYFLKPVFDILYIILTFLLEAVLTIIRIFCYFFFNGPGGVLIRQIFTILTSFTCYFNLNWYFGHLAGLTPHSLKN